MLLTDVLRPILLNPSGPFAHEDELYLLPIPASMASVGLTF
jgi:hypothetical protein